MTTALGFLPRSRVHQRASVQRRYKAEHGFLARGAYSCRDALQGGPQRGANAMLCDLFQGWSWEEIVRINELFFMGSMILAAVFMAGLLNISGAGE